MELCGCAWLRAKKGMPAYSPELNPQEQVWGGLKGKFFGNRFFKGTEEVVDKAVGGCRPSRSPLRS